MVITLFLLFIFLKQFYIFPSGSIGLAEYQPYALLPTSTAQPDPG